jgi:hypothetical protein
MGWTTWSPLQSNQVREIADHFTPAEHRTAMLFGALYGLWVAATFAIPITFNALFSMPLLTRAALVFLIIIHLIAIPVALKFQKRLLCRTEWAKAQGIQPEQLKLFR